MVSAGAELTVLALVDLVFISAFNISMLSNREAIEKMAHMSPHSLGWRSTGGEYGALGAGEDRGGAIGTRGTR